MPKEILEDMVMTRKLCSMCHKAREQAGFNSRKYPVTDIKISHYLMPQYRELIAEECNSVGYMDIPAVEWDFNKPDNTYIIVEDGDLWVAVSMIRSGWQDEIYNERLKKRELAEKRKNEQ